MDFFDDVNDVITLCAVVAAHTIDVLFKIPFLKKACQCILFKVRYRTGIKAELFIEAMQQMPGKTI